MEGVAFQAIILQHIGVEALMKLQGLEMHVFWGEWKPSCISKFVQLELLKIRQMQEHQENVQLKVFTT